MKAIDESLRIYTVNPQELTYEQARLLHESGNLKSGESLSNFVAFYDESIDTLIYNESVDKGMIHLGIKALTYSADVSFRNLERLEACFLTTEYLNLVETLRFVVMKRQTGQKEVNPNTRFLCIGDDIFQISKIVSVKCRDEGNRSFLEVFVTNKRASVRKEFPYKRIRDAEFAKIKKVLGQTA